MDGGKWEKENWKERNEPGKEVTRREQEKKMKAKRKSVESL